MESRLEHAKAVSRRLLTLRFVGLLALVGIIAFYDTQIERYYILFCAGCALLQTAYLDFPNPRRANRFLSLSSFEVSYPSLYNSVFTGLRIFAFSSFIAEFWLGFHFFKLEVSCIRIVCDNIRH